MKALSLFCLGLISKGLQRKSFARLRIEEQETPFLTLIPDIDTEYKYFTADPYILYYMEQDYFNDSHI